MIKYFLRRQLDKFERDFNYDTSYARELLDASPTLTFLLFLTNAVARRPREISKAAWYAAQSAAVLEADCGPCAQLGLTLAIRDGVSPDVFRSLLSGQLNAAPEDARLAFLYARHAMRRSVEAETYRNELLLRYGARALTRLAHRVALTHLFPTLKYLLGHGRSCTYLRFPDDPNPIRPTTARDLQHAIA